MSLQNNFKKLVESHSTTSSDWKKESQQRLATTKSRKWSRKLALRVLQALQDKGMTQVELAEKMGVSRQHISKIVKGQENATFETIEKLENALEISG